MQKVASRSKGGIKAPVMRMFGVALLWVSLAALVYVPTSGGGAKGTVVATVGFFAFAAGLSLLADALKRQIVLEVRRDHDWS